MNPSVRRQASSDASWNSSCLRSKKLCGAPPNSTSSYSTSASRSARSNSRLSLVADSLVGAALQGQDRAAHLRHDHDPGGDAPLRKGAERGEAVAVLAFEDEVGVGDGRAGDARDRRLRVELETHRAGAYETDRRAASYHRARDG